MITNNIRRTLFLVALVTLLTSCAPSYNSLQLFDNCSYKYESIVKAQDCTYDAIKNLRRNGGTIYTSDAGLQNYLDGLVYKVRTNQLSDREAWTRLRNYQVQQNNAARQRAKQTGEAFDGLNCLFFGVAC